GAAVVLAPDELQVRAHDTGREVRPLVGCRVADRPKPGGEFAAVAHEGEDGNELTAEELASLHRPDECGDGGLAELLVAFGVELTPDALPGLVARRRAGLGAREFDPVVLDVDRPALLGQVGQYVNGGQVCLAPGSITLPPPIRGPLATGFD